MNPMQFLLVINYMPADPQIGHPVSHAWRENGCYEFYCFNKNKKNYFTCQIFAKNI